MCGGIIESIFGGGRRSASAAPAPVSPPTPPPPPVPTQTAPVEAPPTPTPSPVTEDESKRKAKVSAKKIQKKKRSAGTTQLATKKPATGGLQGINTPQGVNTGTTPATPTTTKQS